MTKPRHIRNFALIDFENEIWELKLQLQDEANELGVASITSEHVINWMRSRIAALQRELEIHTVAHTQQSNIESSSRNNVIGRKILFMKFIV